MLFIFCIYSSNPSDAPSANDSGIGEDDEDSVQNGENEKEKKKVDATEDENRKPKNKKCDIKPTSTVTEDENRKLKNKKRDVKPKSDVKEDENGKPNNKKRDVNNDSDEDLVIKRSKTSVVSLRRSARQQQNKNEIKNKLSKLKNQRSKKLAAPFILDKSDVTF